jgi:hypothetical protein
MAKNLYKNAKINDFNKYNCIKLSCWFYFSTAYLLKAYFVWIMSIASSNDRMSFITMIYPEQKLFYVNLFSGLMGIFLFILISLRRPNANKWVKDIWPKIKSITIFMLFLDLLITLIAFFIWQLLSLQSVLLHAGVVLTLLVNAFNNDRLILNLLEFPEEI